MLDPHPTTEGICFAPIDLNSKTRNPDASSDVGNMEILGSVPVWALAGLRLQRVGFRLVTADWEVGVYRIAIAPDKDLDFLDD